MEHAGVRFGDPVLSLGDPDGMQIESSDGGILPARLHPEQAMFPLEHAIRGFDGVTLCEQGFELTAQS